MPIYKQCVSCGLHLPISIMQPIEVIHNGRKVIVGICTPCKEKKENEAKKKKENYKP